MNVSRNSQIDFLAIGDIVIDAFVKIKDAHMHCKVDTDTCELCFRFGDKVPYESLDVIPAVGNSPNAAVAAARLRLRSAIFTSIGDDQNGAECLASLKKDKVMTDYVTTEKGKKTNYHYVLWYGIDRTILIKHTEFQYKLSDEFLKLGKVSWIYLSSLAENSLPYHQEIAEYLKKNPATKLAFQPGTFQMKFSVKSLKDIYERTEVFFCNLEEAERILNKENKIPQGIPQGLPLRNLSTLSTSSTSQVDKLLELSRGIQALGPKIVVISDGPKGAYLYMNGELWYIPIYPDIAPPYERTGAGDAFSSTFTAALALGKSPLEAFSWGPVNAMSVVQQVGAQAGLLSREKLEEYLKVAPENYKVRKIK